MPATTKVPLGASTLNRKWYVDVNTGTAEAPVWTGVFGISECQDSITQTTQDDGDFDSGGYGSSTVTEIAWSLVLKLNRKATAAAPDEYDPGQEHLRLAASEIGPDNRIHCRWYEMNGDTGPKVEAYEGHASVSWSPDGGDKAALSKVTATLNGQGKRIEIDHPAAA
jgi:hypothetical protein